MPDSPPLAHPSAHPQWAERSFHFREFTGRALSHAKTAQGIRIAAVVPTLNESATLQPILQCLKKSPLIDRVIVMDSGSTDGTDAVALAAGAEFFTAAAILPHLPHAQGKGENLWKSLIVAPEADVFLFIDGDLRRFGSRYIHGLIGPLLMRPDLNYIKADYDRPGGGGRVTEVLVRPLFRRYFPELARLGQPLAGEYAARRATLHSLAFPYGYGVEAGHLIDLVRQQGSQCLGQCYLGVRQHRHRPLSELGVMSDAILQTILSRLDLAEPSAERPPLISLGSQTS